MTFLMICDSSVLYSLLSNKLMITSVNEIGLNWHHEFKGDSSESGSTFANSHTLGTLLVLFIVLLFNNIQLIVCVLPLLNARIYKRDYKLKRGLIDSKLQLFTQLC